MKNISERVKQVVASELEIDSSRLSNDSEFTFDLGMDSLDIQSMLIALEEEFNISIDYEELSNVKSVGELTNLIQGKTQIT